MYKSLTLTIIFTILLINCGGGGGGSGDSNPEDFPEKPNYNFTSWTALINQVSPEEIEYQKNSVVSILATHFTNSSSTLSVIVLNQSATCSDLNLNELYSNEANMLTFHYKDNEELRSYNIYNNEALFDAGTPHIGRSLFEDTKGFWGLIETIDLENNIVEAWVHLPTIDGDKVTGVFTAIYCPELEEADFELISNSSHCIMTSSFSDENCPNINPSFLD